MTLVNSVEIKDDGDAKDFNQNDSETLFNLSTISKLSANKPSSVNSFMVYSMKYDIQSVSKKLVHFANKTTLFNTICIKQWRLNCKVHKFF